MQKTAREGSALRSPAAWARFLAIIVVGTILDLKTKGWAFWALSLPEAPAGEDPRGQLLNFLPTLDLLWQRNYGAVFGAWEHGVFWLVSFTVVALLLLLWLFLDSRKRQVWLQTFLGLIVAGALGNLHDRLAGGYVRDFIRFNLRADWVTWGGDGNTFLWPYVFNVADVFISVGVAGLFIIWLATLFQHRPERVAEKAKTP
jgi:signal peptidase II